MKKIDPVVILLMQLMLKNLRVGDFRIPTLRDGIVEAAGVNAKGKPTKSAGTVQNSLVRIQCAKELAITLASRELA